MLASKSILIKLVAMSCIGILFMSFLPKVHRTAVAEDSSRGEVLFLGDSSTIHKSGKYAPWLAIKLFRSGINLTYTTTTEDLNEAYLSKFDALIIYANHDSITKVQERSLRNFVEGGKGLVALHAASHCFRNSDWYVHTVGGQFHAHEKGEFSQTILGSEHPVMEGITEFSTWDEKFVHTRTNPDRTILAERVEGSHREPYTWVRTAGKGRVFYTAFGHDERTWKNVGFMNLVRNGVLWTLGDAVQQHIKALKIPDVDIYGVDTIGDYTTRKLVTKVQPALPASESSKLIQVPPGFKLELFASEPDITSPIAMSWDERGRLWIVESVDYPNTFRETDGASNDRIKICEDTDGDGRADKFTIFADGLNIPTGIVFANDGVIVSMAPDFLFLQDTNGDDVADVKEVIISGWGKFDTHAGPNNLQYGFDNKIWGVVGYSGFHGKVDSVYQSFPMGLYQFNPDGTGLRFLARTSNNTWGMGISENNDVFISTANNTHSTFYSMRQQPVQRFLSAGIAGVLPVQKIETHYDSHTLTPNTRQWDVAGGFTSSAGHNLYTARTYPHEYWNRAAFICEPTVRLVHRGFIEPNGAGFSEVDGWNLTASTDEWFGPVQASVGPDGHVWVADWYNFILLHNIPNPNNLEYLLPTEWMKTGAGNAVITPLRNNNHGRIYRVVYQNGKASAYPKLTKQDPEGLVTALKQDNMFWRMHAQRMLVELGDRSVVPYLYKLLENRSVDEVGLNTAAVHALWTLHGLGVFDSADPEALARVEQALQHPAAGVRKAAVAVLPATAHAFTLLAKHNLLSDPSLNTRLTVFNRLVEFPRAEALARAVWESTSNPENESDQWLNRALHGAAAAHDVEFLEIAATEKGSRFSADIAETLQEERYPISRQTVFPFSPDFAGKELKITTTLSRSAHGELRGFVVGQGGLLNGYSLFIRSEKVVFCVKHQGTIAEVESTRELPERFQVTATLAQSGEMTILIDDEVAGQGMTTGLLRASRTSGALHGTGGNTAHTVSITEPGLRSGSDFPDLRIGNYPNDFSLVGNVEGTHVILKRPAGGVKTMAQHHRHPAAPTQIKPTATPQSQPGSRQRISLSVVPSKMQFDKKEIRIRAGQPVTLNFENPDGMPHNMVILKPGTLEKVGAAADAMLSDPKASEKHYVPKIQEVLHHTKVINAGESTSIEFVAPEKAGDYPFVCTFPGHWRLMHGILKVE